MKFWFEFGSTYSYPAARGIFGAPSFFVDGELFWGNDRLDEALAWATRGSSRVAERSVRTPKAP